ncbi:MarC family protein [Skermanella mucosa]|uniref:MarC family protein n=1 Tax=Skermanella mucosa TaxID=1789672 RepID=UPI00192B6805|nr:MarC family protein [Skermanella mucosa]UEM20645.1 MarC family protein [Skermanella mucosa]
MLDLALTSAVALLVTIDPIGTGPVFAALTRGSDDAHRRRMAVKGVLIAAGILFVFAFVGDFLLRALGIGFPAFRIAGGILLLLLAIDMAFARPSGLRSTTEPEQEEATHKEDISVFPLAIPLIAGPGALTSLLLLMGKTDGDPLARAVVLGVLALVLLANLAVLLAAGRMTKLMGVTGVNVVNRILGILLAALACQFVIDGILQSGIVRT